MVHCIQHCVVCLYICLSLYTTTRKKTKQILYEISISLIHLHVMNPCRWLRFVNVFLLFRFPPSVPRSRKYENSIHSRIERLQRSNVSICMQSVEGNKVDTFPYFKQHEAADEPYLLIVICSYAVGVENALLL